jgi:NADPH:quinone reductase-like Zn-dependent oxidoreductase
MRIMQQRLLVTGSTLRTRTIEFKRAMRDQLLKEVWPLLIAGRVRPVVDSVFALAEASKAHARMESSEHMGKIILAAI